MRNIFTLSTIALLAPLLLAAQGLAADPPGSTPSGPAPSDPGPPIPQPPNPGPSTVPMPGLPPGPAHIGIERHVPPPQPPTDLTAAQDAEVDSMIGVIVIFPSAPNPGLGGPQSLAGFGDGPLDLQGLLETDCQWTNDNVADCIVWECDSSGNCEQYGHYCLDANGNPVPCP